MCFRDNSIERKHSVLAVGIVPGCDVRAGLQLFISSKPCRFVLILQQTTSIRDRT